MFQKRTWAINSPRSLGAALRAFREAEGITQEQLAEELGTSRQRLARMEDGRFASQTLFLIRLLKRLGASLKVE